MAGIPLQRQNTEQILSYYLNAGPDIDDDGSDAHDDTTATPRRPLRSGAPPENRRLHIVELDGQHDLSRRFDRSRLALVAPPETASAPSAMDTSPPQMSTPITTPAIGDSKQIGTKVAAPVMTRLGSQDTWLPPSPTKAAERSISPRGAPPPRPPRLSSPPPRGSPAQSFNSLASASVSASAAPPERRRVDEETRLIPVGAHMVRGNSDYSIMAVSDSSE